MRKVLVVDDNDLNLKILANILKKDYEVYEATNGQEALNILFKLYDEISAVMLDIVMPVMDGYDTLQRMREDDKLKNIPVIVTTGETEDGAEVKALSYGANDYIKKPYNQEVIKRRLKNTINLRESSAVINAIKTDALTGFYSRIAFLEKVKELIVQHEPGYYVMACFDINGFKVVNDQYGTAKGDDVLRFIAKTFREGFAGKGAICCRIMADNFAVMYPKENMTAQELEEIRTKAAALDGSILPITYSIGRYVIDDLSLSPSAIYDRSAIAMNSVKGSYDNHIGVYDEAMLESILLEQEIISEMKIALKKNQFEAWYQPQYNHQSGALIGAEALVRWRHPKKGLISPAVFIPIFEKNGFIYELDKYIWEQACKNLRKWLDEGRYPLPLSVNISRYDIFRADLVDYLKGLIEKYNLDYSLLRLEVTESAFEISADQIIYVVKSLIDCGFTVEIDDFGSGYSSLNTLKDVPASVLKLDMRFLENSQNSSRGGNIVESVVRMAKWINMAVIAEGVETLEQADYLKSIGCNYVQGYLYAKPMPLDEYENIARNAKKEEKLIHLETVDTLDNNAFWDPKSMDTLIFNSYVGGACIFEYRKNYVEMLRANDKYAETLSDGNHIVTLDVVLKLKWLDILDNNERIFIRKHLKQAIKTGKEVVCEFKCDKIPGNKKPIYLRATLRVIATTGDRYLVYCSNENTTAQREAEEKEHTTYQLMCSIMDNAGNGITATKVHNNKLGIVFANDKFYEIMGYTRAQYRNEVKNTYDIVHPDDRQRIMDELLREEADKKQRTLEYRAYRRDGELLWLKSTLTTAIINKDDGVVQLGILRDVTLEKKAEQQLRETDEQLKFLNDTAHELLAVDDSRTGIQNVLTKTLNYFQSSRAYILEIDFFKQVLSNTFEVCESGVQSVINSLQDVPVKMFEYWISAINEKNYLCITNVNEIDHTRIGEKKLLQKRGVNTLIAVPIKRDGKLIGFFGIDDPKLVTNNIDSLIALGDYLAVMLTRRDLNAKIENDNKALLSIMNDTPGGFVRIKICKDGSIEPVYINDGFCNIVKMSRNDISFMYSDNPFNGVHPDDVNDLKRVILNLVSDGGTCNTRCRLIDGAGEYVYVHISGKMSQDKSGEKFLNIYYSDIDTQNKVDALREELLENLPCGAGIYEIKQESISIVYLNKRYMELTGRKIDFSSKDISALEAVAPEDRAMLIKSTSDAIHNGKINECNIHILNNNGGYTLFHLTGLIQTKSDGRVIVYVTYSRVNDKTLSYQEMLPVAMSTLMKATKNITFVKDINHRYICCSNAFAKFAGKNSEKEFLGKTDFEMLDKRFAEQYQNVENQIFKTKQPITDYQEMLTPSGMVRYITTVKYPLLDLNDDVIGFFGSIQDNTDAQNALEQLKTVTNNIPGGIASFNVNDDGLTFKYYNEGFYEVFGYPRDKFEQKIKVNPFFAIYKEDLPLIADAVQKIRRKETDIIECSIRVNTNDNKCCWICIKGSVCEKRGDTYVVNIVILDITDQKKIEEQLKISEETFRIAASVSDRMVARYDINTKTYYNDSKLLIEQGFGKEIENVPQIFIDKGIVVPESVDDIINVYNKITSGEKSASATVQLRVPGNIFRWFKIDITTIFNSIKKPAEAIIVFHDVTHKREREAIYTKWQQSLYNRNAESYSLFKCNLSKNQPYDSVEGNLIKYHIDKSKQSFNFCSKAYAENKVYKSDVEEYAKIMHSDILLANYIRGVRNYKLEYREIQPDGSLCWRSLSIELVEYPDSTDILAYLMYEDIDEKKQKELKEKQLALTDPLTGVLNRLAFSEKMNREIKHRKNDETYAFLMFDVDDFKYINDNFGHATGDSALITITERLSSILKHGDIIGRLGGDEFVIFLCGTSGKASISKKAKQICEKIHRPFCLDIKLSVSLGISLCPIDGEDFKTLYHKADTALYHVKKNGKNNFAFYSDDMKEIQK